MITLADLAARMRRLEELTRGLAKEVAVWREGDDPLLYVERKAYLEAIQDALAGMESARVVLARARQRLENGSQPGEQQGESPGLSRRGQAPPLAGVAGIYPPVA
jgi:hypothetical protein